MLLILEDNPDKLNCLFSRFRDRTVGKTILCADSVTKAQYLVQKLLETEEFELWLDEELIGSFGHAFLNWLVESNIKPKFVLITTLGLSSKKRLRDICVENNIPHDSWAGPFG